VGETVADAFLKLYFLERACEAQCLALAGGAALLNHPPQGTPEKAAEQGRAGLPMVANMLAWPALRRRMDRVSPGYDR
jgi:ribulose-5-phosphate 4-epimerase/fuculose-1-phosphate aldolase